jgi:hypothetical protein
MILQMLSSPALSAFSASAALEMAENGVAISVAGFTPPPSGPSRPRSAGATIPSAAVRALPRKKETPLPPGSLFDFWA